MINGFSVRQLGAGDDFGERALLRDTPRTATIRAVTDMRLLTIERDAFLQALTGEAGVSFEYGDRLDVPLTEVLGGLPTFDGVDGAGLRRLASAAHREQMPAGTVVCEAGEESEAAYVILSGRVELQRDGQLSSVLVPGDIFGELSVLHRTPRPERAVVTEPVVVAVLPASAMLAVVGDAANTGKPIALRNPIVLVRLGHGEGRDRPIRSLL